MSRNRKQKVVMLSELQGRVPPHNLDAEKAVLGAILLMPAEAMRIIPTTGLLEGHFYHEGHRVIFSAMVRDFKVHGDGTDELTICERLKNEKTLEMVGGELFISDLPQYAVSTNNLARYCEIVVEKFIVRKVAELGMRLQSDAFDEVDINELIAMADKGSRWVVDKAAALYGSDGETTREAIMRVVGDVQNGVIHYGKISTGYRELDNINLHLDPGNFVVIAGRPRMGKTAFALNVLERLAKKKLRSLFFSLEMPKDQLIMRMVSIIGSVDVGRVMFAPKHLDANDHIGLTDATNTSINSGVEIYDEIYDYYGIEMTIRKECRIKKPAVVFIDYLQLMGVPVGTEKETRDRQLGAITRNIKILCKELGVCIVLLSQINRGSEATATKIPQLGHLRESGSIEQDPDAVLAIHRLIEYAENREERTEEEQLRADLIILKNRHGRTGTVRLDFVGHHQRFEERTAERGYVGGSYYQGANDEKDE